MRQVTITIDLVKDGFLVRGHVSGTFARGAPREETVDFSGLEDAVSFMAADLAEVAFDGETIPTTSKAGAA